MTMLAFQGGGAKLVDLLAVATAIREIDFPFTHLAGTSAGSIAATVLAADKDPRLLRDYFIANEASIRRRIPKLADGGLGKLGQLYRVGVRGHSFAQGDLLRQIVKEGLESLGLMANVTVNDLARPNLKIVAANLVAKTPQIYTGDANIVDSIVKSCSLPLIFSSHLADEPHIVDGGLLSNLPVEVLLDDFSALNEIVAIAFETQFDFDPKNTLAYVGGMMSSMIDARTVDSVARLGGDNVLTLDTSIRSFSADDFFKHIKGSYFPNQVDAAKRWLKSWQSRKDAQYGDYRSAHRHPPIYAHYLAGKLEQVDALLQPKLNRTLKHLEVLIEPSINKDEDGYDGVTITAILEPDPGTAQICYTFYTLTETSQVSFISAEWEVFDEAGNAVPHVAVPVRTPNSPNTKIILFFGKPLGGPGEDECCYVITQRQIIHHLMKDLLDGRNDYFRVITSEQEAVRKLTLRLATKRGLGVIRQWAQDDSVRGAPVGKAKIAGGRNIISWEVADLKADETVAICYGR